MFCSQCGNELGENACFCDKCGKMVDSDKSEQKVAINAEALKDRRILHRLWIPTTVGVIILLIIGILIGVLWEKSDSGLVDNVSNESNIQEEKIAGKKYPVHISIYDAVSIVGQNKELVSGNIIDDVKVQIRAGEGIKSGETIEILESGQIDTELCSGSYTLEIAAPGYVTTYSELEILNEEAFVEGYLLPELREEEMAVVLTWNGNVDLDLQLCTPDKSYDGELISIGGCFTEDSHGNRLVADNGTACEVIYMNITETEQYNVLVHNVTDIEAGKVNSSLLSTVNPKLYIYDSSGLVSTYDFPEDRSGVVWKVVSIQNKQIVPDQEVSNQPVGNGWWQKNYKEPDMDNCKKLEFLIKSMVDCFSSRGSVENFSNYKEMFFSGDRSMLVNMLATFTRYPEYQELSQWFGTQTKDNGSYPPEFLYLGLPEIQYFSESMTGNLWNIQSLSEFGGTRTSNDSLYFDFETELAESHAYLENFQTEYLGNNLWQVTADCMIHPFNYKEYNYAKVFATVKRNPYSCFDGFSVVDIRAEAKNQNDTKYSKFISGSEEVYFRDNAYFSDITKGYSLNEIWRKYYEYGEQINVSYAEIDCGNDGEKELAVRFSSPVMDYVYIIKNVDNRLEVCYHYESWGVRSSTYINYYGYTTTYQFLQDTHIECYGYLGSLCNWQFVYRSEKQDDIYQLWQEEVNRIPKVADTKDYEGNIILLTYQFEGIDNDGPNIVDDQNKINVYSFEVSGLNSQPNDLYTTSIYKQIFDEAGITILTPDEVSRRISKREEAVGVTEEIKEAPLLQWSPVNEW